ncbi:hypothetical protein ACFXPS_42065 [Nocardia sp. NPDC059091]|uniref:hypothetical protein n=1 Tax=Nocardia sp. NPDC059091 TaxID=3346724 RepID=UPI0036B716DE
MNPIGAIGYLRTDISKDQQRWDEQRMRHLAARLGYNLRKTVAFSDSQRDPVGQLAELIRGMKEREVEVEAVFIPGPQHFDGPALPAQIVQVVDVITVDPESTYARLAAGELPELNGASR